jgi:hypothetical protein
MKRTFANQSLMSLVAGFFLFGILMLTANRSEAQTNWMQPAQAQQAIKTEMGNLRNIVAANPPASASYNDAMIHAYYYKAIYARLEEGMTVPDAVNSSLSIFPMGGNNQSFDVVAMPSGITVPVDKAKRAGLLLDATALLSQ